MIEPVTVTRMKTLGPGEAFVYYRGNFANDISRSINADSISIKPATAYAAMLRYIQETARNLESEGRIKLSQNIVDLPKMPPLRSKKGGCENYFIEYIATGV